MKKPRPVPTPHPRELPPTELTTARGGQTNGHVEGTNTQTNRAKFIDV